MLGLNAFGDRLQTKGRRKRNNTAHQGVRSFPIALQIGNKALINL